MTASSGGFKLYLMQYVVACYDIANLSSFGLANDTNEVLFTFRRVTMRQQDTNQQQKSTTTQNTIIYHHHLDNAGYAAPPLCFALAIPLSLLYCLVQHVAPSTSQFVRGPFIFLLLLFNCC
jgi:hypothetical protein